VPAKLTAIIIVVFCLMPPVIAADPPPPQKIQVFISPECKGTFYGPDFLDLDVNGKIKKAEKRSRPDYVEWDPARAKPMAFKDPHTRISLYVESDGRHIAAIDPDGKLLWVRNPFEDRHLCPYRSPRPVIGRLEAAKFDDHVIVQFDSSQFGVIDEITGDFVLEGQN
jgi:hypothetical protein